MDYENMQEENEVMQLAEEAAVYENWLRDFKMGIAMGLCLSSQFESKAEPVAYLYGHVAKEGETPTHTINGVDYVGAELPALPEWDREKYPYAIIMYYPSANGYYIYNYQNAAKYDPDYQNDETMVEALVSPGNVNSWFIEEPFEEWVQDDINRLLISIFIGSISDDSYVIWSNYDIINNDDNSVYLSASDPIPIYE